MTAWNKGKRVGQKKAFKLEEIWRIRIRLEIENKLEKLVLFNLAIDSKLRACDLINLKVRNISSASLIQSRAMIGRHICYHYYANIVKNWVLTLGLDITQYGTHSLRRTKPLRNTMMPITQSPAMSAVQTDKPFIPSIQNFGTANKKPKHYYSSFHLNEGFMLRFLYHASNMIYIFFLFHLLHGVSGATLPQK
jgi:hypothetical protein